MTSVHRSDSRTTNPTKGLLTLTLILGFASGLPLALSSGTLQAWLTVENVDLKTLGWLTLLGLPYTYKFVWAPMLDRYRLPLGGLGGRRKGWLVSLLLAMAVVLSNWSRACSLTAGLNVIPERIDDGMSCKTASFAVTPLVMVKLLATPDCSPEATALNR